MGKKRKLDDVLESAKQLKKSKQQALPVASVGNTKSKKSSEHANSSETFEQKLARTDPDFLEFLKSEKSDLLGFESGDLSADSDDSSADEGAEQRPKKGKTLEKKSKLKKQAREVIEESDDEDSSDVEPGDETVEDEGKRDEKLSKKTSVTMKMVVHWTKQLQDGDSIPVMLDLMAAFKAALHMTGKSEDSSSKFKVTGSDIFNAVVQTSVQNMVPFLLRHLRLPKSKEPNKAILPSSSPRWKQIRQDVKLYAADVLLLLSSVGSADVVRVLLKHLLDLVVFVVGFPKLSKQLMKKLIEEWSSSGNEKISLVAFCALHRLLRLSQESLLESGFKLMYAAYVRNTKFTSPTTLPIINLMQRTLTEIARINISVTYRYAFTYIRQLAIHLRGAITIQKKETTQIVYSWQFIHSLSLWTKVICQFHTDEYIRSLIYPLTQIIIGTIKLVPTAQYYPLRFLCVRELNSISSATSTFIPILPFLMEVLDEMDFQRHVQSSKMQNVSLRCVLKLSKSELRSKPFRDGIIDELYDLLVDSLYIHAHTVGFPELSLPVLIQLRKFVKTCKIPSYTRKMKELIKKITETSSAITQRRSAATLNLRDLNAVAAWEANSQQIGTPLGKFHVLWRKLRDQQLKAEMSKLNEKTEKKQASDDLSDFDDDELERLARPSSEPDEDDEDSEDSSTVKTTVKATTSSKNKKGSQKQDKSETNSKSVSSPKQERVNKLKKTKRKRNVSVSDDSDGDECDVVERMAVSDSEESIG